MSGEDVGIGELDGVGLVGVLVDGGEVLSDDLAQSTELGLSLVGNAELEGLVDDLLVGGEENVDVRRESVGLGYKIARVDNERDKIRYCLKQSKEGERDSFDEPGR